MLVGKRAIFLKIGDRGINFRLRNRKNENYFFAEILNV